jgi:hypothetical protein
MDELQELREIIADIVNLDSEFNALNGGGPNWSKRWIQAMHNAKEVIGATDGPSD